MSPDSLSVIVHAGGYLGALQAAGTVLFLLQFGTSLGASRRSVRRLGVVVALVAMPWIAAHLVLDAARMAGEYRGMMDANLLQLSVWSASGVAHLLEVVGLALIAAGLHRESRLAAAVGAALVLLAFPVTGHTAVHPKRALLAPLLVLHVGLVAFWVGALAPLLLALRHDPIAAAAQLLRRFSASAGVLVPLIPAAGIAMACVLLPGIAALRRPYGLLLGAKLAGFMLLIGLAALNRWYWVPGLVGGARARAALRRSVVAEYLLIAAVLAATAELTTFYSPAH